MTNKAPINVVVEFDLSIPATVISAHSKTLLGTMTYVRRDIAADLLEALGDMIALAEQLGAIAMETEAARSSIDKARGHA